MAVNHHPLRRWRFEQGLTLEEAAEKIGCGKTHLSEIENRRKLPSGHLAVKIAEVTGLSIGRVFDESVKDGAA